MDIRQGKDLKTEKELIRREVLARRAGISPEEKKAFSAILADRIMGHQWFYLSDTVLLYADFGSEIGTGEIAEAALEKGKKVYMPRVEGTGMQFYRIGSLRELAPGFRGIPEPVDANDPFEYRREEAGHVLMIMPGIAFDPYKNRIGYGKGFYDRYLSDKEELRLRTIAVGYGCQMVDRIPCEETDVRPYQVILV